MYVLYKLLMHFNDLFFFFFFLMARLLSTKKKQTMGEHAIEFKAWHVGTQFIVDESHLINQIKMMMQSSDQTKVKVRLDKTSLKLTKITTIPLIGSEKKIPLSDIKNIYTDSTFPLCFFCAVSAHDGHLLKIIVIRCNKEMCATGIVNYFRTLTYK